jgi:hypothetical protein
MTHITALAVVSCKLSKGVRLLAVERTLHRLGRAVQFSEILWLDITRAQPLSCNKS